MASSPHSHEHGHPHDHGRGAFARRARHVLAEVFGSHAHGAEEPDDLLEASDEGRRALWISLSILAITAAAQGFVVALSGSVALLGDTLHNVADALTAVPLLVAFRLAKRPATRRYTYGYGRAEDPGGIFVILMITLSSALAAYQAINRLLHPQDVTHLWAVAAAAVVGFVGNEVVARYRIRVGHRIGSAAMVADGLHARTDGFTSLAVLLGAGGVALGWERADPIIGLLITLAILGVLRSAVRQVGARLMDAIDPVLLDNAESLVGGLPGVLEVRSLKLRWIGHTLHAEVDVAASDTLTFGEGHELSHTVEATLIGAIPRMTSATVHASPQSFHEHREIEAR